MEKEIMAADNSAGRGKDDSSSSEANSASLCFPWLEDLDSTLQSAEGTKALEAYLIREGSLSYLEFIWACDGMKSLVKENPDEIRKFVSCIFKNYIINGELLILTDQVVNSIGSQMEAYFENPEPSDCPSFDQCKPKKMRKLGIEADIFDDARNEIQAYLQDTVFPQFKAAVVEGKVCISERTGSGRRNNVSSTSQLASHPEVFARALCERLEGLVVDSK